MSSSLVTKFIMCFHEHCAFPCFCITRAKNFWFGLVTCLYSNPLLCRKRSTSCFNAFPFARHLEAHLQKGSVLCICSSACNLSLVSSFVMASGVSVTLGISGATISVLGYRVRSSVLVCCLVLLLVWNVGPSWLVADSI